MIGLEIIALKFICNDFLYEFNYFLFLGNGRAVLLECNAGWRRFTQFLDLYVSLRIKLARISEFSVAFFLFYLNFLCFLLLLLGFLEV